MKLRLSVAAAIAILLSGCASREPLDYLPDSAAYVSVNSDRANASTGATRLLKILQQLQPESADLAGLKVSRLYLAIQGTGRNARVCGVAEGGPGFPERVLSELRSQGARDDRAAGRKIVTSGPLSVSAVGDQGVLFYNRPEDLEKMIRASKRKEPQARQTSQFQTLQKLAGDHIITAVMDTAPALAAAGPQLSAVSAMNPKGIEALKQVQSASVIIDWDDHPVIKGVLHLSDAEARKDLASLANFALGFAGKSGAGASSPQLAQLLKQLKATDDEQGVSVKLDVPTEMANAFLERLETTAQQLPSDPEERKTALQKAFGPGRNSRNR